MILNTKLQGIAFYLCPYRYGTCKAHRRSRIAGEDQVFNVKKNPKAYPPPGFFNVKPVQTGLFKINSPEHTKDGGIALIKRCTIVDPVFIILEDKFRNNVDAGSHGDFGHKT